MNEQNLPTDIVICPFCIDVDDTENGGPDEVDRWVSSPRRWYRCAEMAVLGLVWLAVCWSTAVAEEIKPHSGISFEITPYLWVTTIDTTVKSKTAGGGTASTTSSVGFDQLINNLNFAAMLAASARYERFSLLTDFMYLNVNAQSSQIRSVELSGTSIPISSTLSAGVSSRIQSSIWTMAGGYTVADERWGQVDVLGGFRMLSINQKTNYGLTASIVGPNGAIALSRGGSLSGGGSVWNGIIGVRGRLNLGDTNIFVPYYLDVGTGGSDLTWQAFAGIGYHLTGVDLSLGYRYLSFHQGGNAIIQKLQVKGPILVATFAF